jgi:stage III sporulation protein AH
MTVVTDKRVVASLLFVLLVAFVYVGYFNREEELDLDSTDINMVSETLGSQVDVDTNNVLQDTPQLENLSSEEYFIEYRLNRDRTRSRQIELLQSIVNNTYSTDKERQEAQQKILAITNTLEQELKLENIIKAKGYEDSALFIQSNSVVVIIKGHDFDSGDATIIGDLVAKTTGHSLDQVTIIPKA